MRKPWRGECMYGGRRDNVDAHNSEAGWKSGVVARRMEVFERGEKGKHFCWWFGT